MKDVDPLGHIADRMAVLASLLLTVRKVVVSRNTMYQIRKSCSAAAGIDSMFSRTTTIFGAELEAQNEIYDVPPNYLELIEEELYL